MALAYRLLRNHSLFYNFTKNQVITDLKTHKMIKINIIALIYINCLAFIPAPG